ncbi:IS66 family insertion sequence element accessory protein TnpB, partial [Marinovum algicola]|uniref:IS66 family insertion sequence element accessory protein TnpB n=1 Tax=Marinovum algicola TaxID=42444 RepID=UPI003D2EABCB
MGLKALRSGYALPATLQPHVLILIDAGFSSCLSRCRRRGDRVKLLYWDGQGFCLYYKVLEK